MCGKFNKGVWEHLAERPFPSLGGRGGEVRVKPEFSKLMMAKVWPGEIATKVLDFILAADSGGCCPSSVGTGGWK